MLFRSYRRQKGVTLLEILVAMVVMTIGLFMVYQIFPMGFATSLRSRNKTIATQLAQQKLEEILQSRQEVECLYHKSGGVDQCKYRPLQIYTGGIANSLPNESIYFGSDFDCRFYYSIPGTTRGTTVGHFDSGVLDDPASWTPFDPPMNNFWWHVQVIPVIDPAANYAAYDPTTDRGSLYRDWGCLSQVVVRVRGPVDNIGQDIARTGTAKRLSGPTSPRIPVEVVLSTFVGNKFLPSTEFDAASWGIFVDESQKEYFKRVMVKNIRNFPFFNRLTNEEMNDLSIIFYEDKASGNVTPVPGHEPYVYDSSSHTYSGDANKYKLDNVVIEQWDTVTNHSLYQTNRLLSVEPDDPWGNPVVSQIKGYMYFARPLYYNGSLTSNPSNPNSTNINDQSMLEKDSANKLWLRGAVSDSTHTRFRYRVFLYVNIPRF